MTVEVFLCDSNQKNRSNDSVMLYRWETAGIILVFSPGSINFFSGIARGPLSFRFSAARSPKEAISAFNRPGSFDNVRL